MLIAVLVLAFRGSVVPQAAGISFLSGCLAVLVFYRFRTFGRSLDDRDVKLLETSFSISFTAILGFLLVFRAQQAYSRYWEGISLVRDMQGRWYTCASALVSFCSSDRKRRVEVQKLQGLIVRLTSLLYTAGVHELALSRGEDFEAVDTRGIEAQKLGFVGMHPRKSEVLLQWVQRVINDGVRGGLIDAPPPIVAQAIQELAGGFRSLCDATKLSTVPFPYTYAQMMRGMLLGSLFSVPLFSGWYASTAGWAFLLTFASQFFFLITHLVAEELEMPFRGTTNFSLYESQRNFNRSLVDLLDRNVQMPPTFELFDSNPGIIRTSWGELRYRAGFKREAKPLKSGSLPSFATVADLKDKDIADVSQEVAERSVPGAVSSFPTTPLKNRMPDTDTDLEQAAIVPSDIGNAQQHDDSRGNLHGRITGSPPRSASPFQQGQRATSSSIQAQSIPGPPALAQDMLLLLDGSAEESLSLRHGQALSPGGLRTGWQLLPILSEPGNVLISDSNGVPDRSNGGSSGRAAASYSRDSEVRTMGSLTRQHRKQSSSPVSGKQFVEPSNSFSTVIGLPRVEVPSER